MNTGSPDAPNEDALRVYLKQFLMDPFVVDMPFPMRYALIHWAILPKRPAESAKAYKEIWTENGSPLIHYCTQLAKGLQTRFSEPVELGMAYGNPSFKQGIEKLLDAGVDEICLLPMFPHYAMATFGSCVAGVMTALKKRAALRVVPPFYLDPTYIRPLAESLTGVEEHILFSYHGLPERHLKKTDPTKSHCLATDDCCETDSPAHATCYRHQCMETTKAIIAVADLPKERCGVSFQSRLGRAKWMEPYTEETLQKLPSLGIKKLAVICPAFFCDCLETLEEIEIRGQETFMEAGGESFRMIPCLNDSPAGIHCLETLMADAANWPSA
ncbi:Ferrochelatase [Pontiella sulfatireligans]|uniref:Ferrochelatase n=2 Tax=Pontiella sulfatireligans TaxID=2750658 RepID=A0A6C2UKG1_9BACT|nr:Ferrochelatase [Pontiella sulfatireligans]